MNLAAALQLQLVGNPALCSQDPLTLADHMDTPQGAKKRKKKKKKDPTNEKGGALQPS